jgi:hypothetical protein
MLSWAAGYARRVIRLLNWAVRYFPIRRVLRANLASEELVLEVGSGSFGLGTFYPYPYVGCDVKFDVTPRKPMMPVRCSATQLPFLEASFAAVVASDVLEHVPPEHRSAVVKETLRVARKVAIFGFPSGPEAHLLDERFHSELKRRHTLCPDWLEEHLLYPFPERALFNDLGGAWLVETLGNDHLGFHDWVNKRELSRYWRALFAILLSCVPGLLEFLLKFADREPFYRMIFVVTRKSSEGIEAR